MSKKALLFATMAVFLFVSMTAFASTALPVITPVIDGVFSDWSGYQPLITDPAGDFTRGLDVTEFRITNDSQNIYLMWEFAQPLSGNTYVAIDADNNASTGGYILPYDMGIEVGVLISPERGFVGDARDMSYSANDFPDALKYELFENWAEASFPLSVLSSLVDDYSTMKLYLANDQGGPALYSLKTTAAPVPAAGILLGSGLLGLIGFRRRAGRLAG